MIPRVQYKVSTTCHEWRIDQSFSTILCTPCVLLHMHTFGRTECRISVNAVNVYEMEYKCLYLDTILDVHIFTLNRINKQK